MKKTIITLLVAMLTALANAQEVNYTITPSNDGTVNYTEFAQVTITFNNATNVELNETKNFIILNCHYMVGPAWAAEDDPSKFTVEGNKVTISLNEDDLRRAFSEDGDYEVAMQEGFFKVDGVEVGRIEQRYTVKAPEREAVEMIFTNATDANGKLWFYLPEGYTWFAYTQIDLDVYDKDGNKVGETTFDEDESDLDGRTFFFAPTFTSESDKHFGAEYHISVPQGLIKMESVVDDVKYPSAAKELYFILSDATGISNVNAANGTAVMYDLNGRKVLNNNHGIKILRDASGKTKKYTK